MASSPAPIKLPATSQAARDRIVATPFQFYLDGSENLRVRVWNSLAGVTVTVRVRFVNDLSKLNWQEYKLTPTSDRAATSLDFPLGGGIISNVVAFASSGTPVIGQTFVQVQVVVGSQAAAPVYATVLQGYVTAGQNLAYPGSIITSSLDGGGYVRFVNGTAPAAGAEISETVPTGARWELISILSLLSCSGVAGNRRPAFIASQSGNPWLRIPLPDNLVAGATKYTEWCQGLPFATSFDFNVLPQALPAGLPLVAGTQFGTITVNLDPLDQYVLPRYIVREWLEAQ